MIHKAAVALTTLILALACPLAAEQLKGKVIQDNSGAPVASADVRVYRIGVRELAADLETDGEGRFEAAGLPPGDYRIDVEKPSFVSATSAFRIDPGEDPQLAIRLVRRGSISGQVRSTSGQSVKGVMVRILTKTQHGFRPAIQTQGNYSQPDESGRYRLYNLLPGEYAISVSFGAYTSAVASTGNVPKATEIGSGFMMYPQNSRPELFTISGGEDYRNIDFSIQAKPIFNVSGKVELPAPRTSFWVALTQVDQPSMAVALTPAGNEGGFQFSGIPAGSYYLFASGPVTGRGFMGAMVDKEPLFARTQLEVGRDMSDISLKPQSARSSTFRLKAEPGSEGSCPSTASITLTAIEDWGAMLQHTVRASRDKETVISELAPAKYEIKVSELGANCYQASDVLLDLTGGDPGTTMIPVASGGSIHGVLSGTKQSGISIVLTSPPGGSVRFATPDSEGRFNFSALAPGKYRIAAHRNSESATRWLGGPEPAAEIDIQPGKTTEVELPAPPANPPQ